MSDYQLRYKTHFQQVLHRFHCDQQFKKYFGNGSKNVEFT
jgi:hypothetical protein